MVYDENNRSFVGVDDAMDYVNINFGTLVPRMSTILSVLNITCMSVLATPPLAPLLIGQGEGPESSLW
jgi:hypothetical protein